MCYASSNVEQNPYSGMVVSAHLLEVTAVLREVEGFVFGDSSSQTVYY